MTRQFGKLRNYDSILSTLSIVLLMLGLSEHSVAIAAATQAETQAQQQVQTQTQIQGQTQPQEQPPIQSRLTPKQALDRLMKGNALFVQDTTICPNKHQDRRTITASKQRPFAIVLGCSDSRVPPELAFDQGIGDIFVVRIAGNVVGPTELDSVDYSAIHNDSSIIVVLGHENCGAVSAVLANNTKDIESIAAFMKPAIDQNQNLVAATEANIRNSVARIKASPPIAKLIREGKIDVVGAYYNLESGEVQLLGEQKSSP